MSLQKATSSSRRRHGAIDLENLDRATDFYFEKGADGITILGMMGEAPKLTMAEFNEVAARAIAVLGTGR